MKYLLMIVMVLAMCSNALAVDVTFVVPDEKIEKLGMVIRSLFTGDEVDSKTDKQLFVYLIKDYFSNLVYSYDQRVAAQAAADSVTRDNDIVQ